MNQKTNRIFRIASAGFAALAAGCQLFAVLFQWDVGSNYFQRDAVLPVLAILFFLFSTVCGILRLPAKGTGRKEPSPARFFVMGIGFLLAFFGVLLSTPPATTVPATETVRTIALILLPLSALACGAMGFLKNNPGASALLGFVPIFGCAALPVHYYFDEAVEMNSPLKTFLQLGLLLGMLLCVGEVRFFLEKPQIRVFAFLRAWFFPEALLSVFLILPLYVLCNFVRLDYLAGVVLLLCLEISSLLPPQKTPYI